MGDHSGDMTDEPTRQPMALDDILSQVMRKLEVDTPGAMLVSVFEIVDKLAFYEDAATQPAPLLNVDAAGRITIRNDVTLRGLIAIVDTLQNMRIAGA